MRSAQIDLEAWTCFHREHGEPHLPRGFDPAGFAKVGLLRLTEDEDRAAKHPTSSRAADLILLDKVDLQP